MKKVTHKLWPVSYLDSNGNQQNDVWGFKPYGEQYSVGNPFTVEIEHPELTEAARMAAIAELEKQLDKLRGVAA